jgi:hypothetical protein
MNVAKEVLSVLIYTDRLFLVLFPLCSPVRADLAGKMADCAKLDNKAERLQCFDDLAGRQTPVEAKITPPRFHG